MSRLGERNLEPDVKQLRVRFGMMNLLNGVGPGKTWGSILVLPVNSTAVRRYDPTSAGLIAATASLSANEMVWVPPGTYTASLTWPDNIAISSMGRYTRIIGTQTFLGDAYPEGIVFSNSAESAGTVSVLQGPGSGYVLLPNNCTVECINSGSGASHAIVDNGGRIIVWDSVVQAIAASGDGYAGYLNAGQMGFYHSTVYGSTDWFNSANVQTYCVTEMAPEEPVGNYEYHANVYVSNTTSTTPSQGYFVPWTDNIPPAAPTGISLITSANALRGLIARGDYIYYSGITETLTNSARGVHRWNVQTDEHKQVFNGADGYELYNWDHAEASFAVLDDDNILARTYSDEGYHREATFRKANLATDEVTTVAAVSMPEPGGDTWSSPVYYHWLVHNRRLIISGIVQSDDAANGLNWTFHFWVYDIDTGTEVSHYTSDPMEHTESLQYPWSPPVVVDGKVYITYDFGFDQSYPGIDETAYIWEIDTTTGAVRVARPHQIGQNVYLFQGTYDPASGKICYITYTAGDSDYYSVMALDPDTLDYTFLYEDSPPGSGTSPLFLVRSQTQAYLIRYDGGVYSLTNFAAPLTTIPMPASVLYQETPQPNKICNVVDDAGNLWISKDGNLYAYPVAGGAATEYVLEIPDPVAGAGLFYPQQLIYLTDGKLFIMNRNTSNRTTSIYKVT
jgi:hypothetical protein